MSDVEFHALAPPPDAVEKGGFEIMRASIVDGDLSTSLKRAFDDPETWGRLLADLARDVAGVYAEETGMDASEALQRICAMFADELSEPDDGGDGPDLAEI